MRAAAGLFGSTIMLSGMLIRERVSCPVSFCIVTAGAKAYRSKEIHTWNEEEIATFK